MTSLTWTNLFTLTAPKDYKGIRLLDNLINQIADIIRLETNLIEEIYLELDSNLKYLENILENICCWQIALYFFLDEKEQIKLLNAIKNTQKLINNFKIYKNTEFLSTKFEENLNLLEKSGNYFFKNNNQFHYYNKKYKINEKFKITSNNEYYFIDTPIKKTIKNPDFFEKQVLYAEAELNEICQPAINRFLFVVFTFGLGMIAIKTYDFLTSFWASPTNEESQKNLDKTNDKQQSIYA